MDEIKKKKKTLIVCVSIYFVNEGFEKIENKIFYQYCISHLGKERGL